MPWFTEGSRFFVCPSKSVMIFFRWLISLSCPSVLVRKRSNSIKRACSLLLIMLLFFY